MIDPNLQGTLSAVAQLVTAVGVPLIAILGFMNRRTLKVVAAQTDGLTTALVDKEKQLGEAHTSAAISAGEANTVAAAIAGHVAGVAQEKAGRGQLRREGDKVRAQ